MNEALRALADKTGYRFDNPDLLQQALTHRSAGTPNYERLEFLGDSLLNFVIADALFHAEPAASEGDLTRLRASLVRAGTLAEIAGELGLGNCLRLGAGELGGGGFRRKSILADGFEALLGGIYLDGGYTAVRKAILRVFSGRLENLPAAESLKDAKTRLQETLQGRGLDLPEYVLVATRGEEHKREFTMACRVPSLSLQTEASGGSRRKAEQAAAAAAIKAIAALDDVEVQKEGHTEDNKGRE